MHINNSNNINTVFSSKIIKAVLHKIKFMQENPKYEQKQPMIIVKNGISKEMLLEDDVIFMLNAYSIDYKIISNNKIINKSNYLMSFDREAF